MEAAVIAAIGALGAVFLAALLALLLACRHRHGAGRRGDGRAIADLIGAAEAPSEPSELELDDVVIPNAAVMDSGDWMEDAPGLVSHCIAILRICHTLTEKLVAMTMGSGGRVKSPSRLSDIIVVAKRISPRVDDVVRSMYPPLDPKLLDARAAALLLSVSHLVLLARSACPPRGDHGWAERSLAAAEQHMAALRRAAVTAGTGRDCAAPGGQRHSAI